MPQHRRNEWKHTRLDASGILIRSPHTVFWTSNPPTFYRNDTCTTIDHVLTTAEGVELIDEAGTSTHAALPPTIDHALLWFGIHTSKPDGSAPHINPPPLIDLDIDNEQQVNNYRQAAEQWVQASLTTSRAPSTAQDAGLLLQQLMQNTISWTKHAKGIQTCCDLTP